MGLGFFDLFGGFSLQPKALRSDLICIKQLPPVATHSTYPCLGLTQRIVTRKTVNANILILILDCFNAHNKKSVLLSISAFSQNVLIMSKCAVN